jgi:hypothetical protein
VVLWRNRHEARLGATPDLVDGAHQHRLRDPAFEKETNRQAGRNR